MNPQPPDEFPSDTPQPLANEQVPAHVPPGLYATQGFSDRANFVENLVTLRAEPLPLWWGGTGVPPPDCSTMPVPGSPSASGRPPVLTLAEVKLWVRIDPANTAEDDELLMMEMASRLHTENYIRRTLDADPTTNPDGIGENVKMAMLLLVAHWYRNRELMVSGRLATTPYAYEALLLPERDYPCIY